MGVLGSVAAIKNVGPRDYYGSFDPLTLHKRCRCTLEFRASDYVGGRRQDTVFLALKALLEPFGITRYCTDGWGAYERHLDAEEHEVGKANTQKIESKHINMRTRIKRLVRRTTVFPRRNACTISC